MSIPMPTLVPQRKGRTPKGLTVVDVEGKIYVLNSVRRFAEMIGVVPRSIYSLSSGNVKCLCGLTMYTGSLEGKVEGVDYFVVESDS